VIGLLHVLAAVLLIVTTWRLVTSNMRRIDRYAALTRLVTALALLAAARFLL
jgi:hypothetical protein